MKTKKIGKLKQKIIISLITVMMTFTWIMPTYSQADFGGALLEPVCDLLLAVGDIANFLVSKTAGVKSRIIPGTTDANLEKIQEEECNGFSNAKEIQAYFGGKLIRKEVKLSKYSPEQAAEDDIDYIPATNIVYPHVKITPMEIFSGRVALLDANFFQEVNDDYKARMLGAGEVGEDSDTGNSTVADLKETISTWYQALRMIAIVGLLSVLVYVGLRMVTSAVATDKAKYKEMFVDWVIALCLVFFLHYIMVFTMTMVQEVQNLFISGPSTSSTNNDANKKTINTILLVYRNETLVPKDTGNNNDIVDTPVDSGTGNFDTTVPSEYETLVTEKAFPTNLTGYNRVLAGNPDAIPKLTYTIMYLALTFYTVYFFFIYIKRVIILTFLTIIAPLVALTYPIDKVKDSKAQAFEFWLREYIVNAMIPIIHLVLYTVLVTSAIDLAVKSPLYAICVLAFIVPAEKIVKEMFGIKSSTAPALGGFAGGALAAQMVQKLGKGGKDKGKDGKSDKIRTKDDKNVTDPNLVEGDGLDALAGTDVNAGNAGIPMAGAGGGAGANPTPNQAPRTQQPSGEPQRQGPPTRFQAGMQNAWNATGGRAVSAISDSWNSDKNRQRRKNFGNTGRTLLKRAAKGVGRTYLKGAALIGGAAIGLAGGIVGGDMNDMWKGAALGGTAGSQLGKKASAGIESLAGTVQEDVREINYGEDEANNLFADQEFVNDVENRAHVVAKIEEENRANNIEMDRFQVNDELEKRMQEYAQYRRAGITDIKEMDRLHKIQESMRPTQDQIQNMTQDEQEQNQRDIEAQTRELAKLSTRYSADMFRDAGKIDKARDALAQRFEKKGIESARANALAADTMAKIRKIKGEA